MDEPVQPLLGRPVLTRAFKASRLTTIAVHTNATTPDGQAYDVLFIGTGMIYMFLLLYLQIPFMLKGHSCSTYSRMKVKE